MVCEWVDFDFVSRPGFYLAGLIYQATLDTIFPDQPLKCTIA